MFNRHGLTLLELVVVLTILAALGGLVVPLIRGYQDQTSDAASIDSLRELTKVVAEHEANTGRFPNNLESLLSGTSLFAKLPGSPDGNGDLIPLALNASQVDALEQKGLTTVLDANATPSASATFDSVVVPPRTLAATGNVTSLDAGAVFRQLGKIPGTQPSSTGVPVPNLFVVFGFGRNADIIGSLITEAPFRVPGIGNPNNIYCRYGLVFEIPGATAVGQDVSFVGAVAFDSHTENDGTVTGIRGVQSFAEDFYSSR